MVDVSTKPNVLRTAVARGRITLAAKTVDLIRANQIAKGDVLAVARVAGVMAAKKTPDLIPLCHTLRLDQVVVECTLQPDGVVIEATARCTGPTGVEMEALTAVSTAALTVYDMCKAVDDAMQISEVELIRKTKESLPHG